MNKSKVAGFVTVIGTLVGIWICIATKKKQKAAKKLGVHIPFGPYEAILKRPLDMFLACLGIVLLWPVMVFTAILVRIRIGSPILFKQNRPGLDKKIFTIFKFCTMTDKRDDGGALLPDEERLTSFGKKLRSMSLDELPELINIVKGDMAIVGPRPLLVEYLPRYNRHQERRHEVRPGLTGYAQVSGRNNLSWDEKFKDDVKYVDNITFLGDLKIILKTIKVVLKRTGVNSETSVTMEAFMGNR